MGTDSLPPENRSLDGLHISHNVVDRWLRFSEQPRMFAFSHHRYLNSRLSRKIGGINDKNLARPGVCWL